MALTLHLDIEDFFGHINRSRITRCLKGYFSYKDAREIAIESTVRVPESPTAKYILPFGFVQSPILASVCLSKSALGHQLSRISRINRFTVSIYMDDITISGNDLDALNEELEKITAASLKSRLPLSPDKQEGPCDAVTAFNIHLSQGLLKITENKIKELFHTYTNSTNENQRSGIRNYVVSVNPDQAKLF